jgi:hypothetical protein
MRPIQAAGEPDQGDIALPAVERMLWEARS